MHQVEYKIEYFKIILLIVFWNYVDNIKYALFKNTRLLQVLYNGLNIKSVTE